MATITDLITRGVKNRLVRTEDFGSGGTAPWTLAGGATVSVDVTTAPDGTSTTADLLSDPGASLAQVYRDVSSSDPYVIVGTLATFSVYLKPPTSSAAPATRLVLTHVGSSGPIAVTLEINWTTLLTTRTTSGSIGFASSDFRNSTNGWYRASVTTKITAGSNLRCEIQPSALAGATAATGGIWAWGAQFEEGGYPTEYLPVLGDTDTTVSPTPAGITTVYSSIPAWLSAISADTTNVRIGKLKNEDYILNGAAATFARTGTTGIGVLSRLEPEGANFNPVTNIGPRVIVRWPSAGTSWGLKITESHVEIKGIGFYGDAQGRGGSSNLVANGAESQPVGWSLIWIDVARNCTIANCYFNGARGGGDTNAGNDTLMHGVYIGSSVGSGNPSQQNALFNCIFQGGGPRSNRGFDIAVFWGNFAQYGGAFNCAVYGIVGHANGKGFLNAGQSWTNGALAPVPSPEIINCIAVECVAGAFTGIWQTFRYNIASDGTATSSAYWNQQQTGGVPSTITSIGTISDKVTNSDFVSGYSLWLAPDQQDFRLRSGARAADSGLGIHSRFIDNNGPGTSVDIVGATRQAAGQLWDIGPYEGQTIPGHPLSGTLSLTSTGATSSQNGTGDTQVRLACAATGSLLKGETLNFLTSTGFITVVVQATVAFTGTSGSPDRDNVVISPALPSDAIIGAVAIPGQEFVLQTKTIGLDRSRDFSSVGALFANLPRSLYYLNQRWVGTAYADGLDVLGATIEAHHWNCVTSSASYIEIKADKNIDFRTQLGPRMDLNLDVDGYSLHRAVFWLGIPWTRITGIQMRQSATTATNARNARVLELFSDDCLIDACAFIFDGNYSRSIGMCCEIEGNRNQVRNSIARGSNTTGDGAQVGFALTQDSRQNQILHCIAYRIKGGTDAQVGGTRAQGFIVRNGNANARVSGCISLETNTSGTGGPFDFDTGAGLAKETVFDHCFASDTSPGNGEGNKVSLTASQIFKNAPIGDFRLVSTPSVSLALNAGANLTPIFGTDATGATRRAPYDVGIFEGLVYPPLMKTPAPRDHHRLCSLWEIVRTDGVAHYFTSASEPIPFAGQTYKPAGQTQDSAKRMEAALREQSTDLLGAIVSGEIDPEDLAAGVFSGAIITERKVDWRFPWTAPSEERVWRVAQIEFDRTFFRAELIGPTAVLDQRVGELLGVDCPAEFGDGDCGKDLTAITQYNISVSAVSDTRREFTATSMSGTGVFTDDYFGAGKVTFLSGLNAGISVEIKSYIGSSKTIRLMFKTPFTITVNDKINVIPGCRKRYKKDCIDKHNNGINNQGRALIGGPDVLLETPTR